MSLPWIRAAAPVLAVLLAALPLHAQEDPDPADELREPKQIWTDMLEQWERIEKIEQGDKSGLEELAAIEGSANELGTLLGELQLSINDHPVPSSWEPLRLIKINTGLRFLGQELNKLRNVAYQAVPGRIRKPIGMTRQRLWTLQIRFPEGYLSEPLLPKPPEVMENDRSLPPELR